MTIPLGWSREEAPERGQVVWRREFPSVLDYKQVVMDDLQAEMLRRGHLPEDETHWLCLCLDEALVNAILHGNEADESVPVVVTLAEEGPQWVLRIDDRGDGFIPDEDVPDPEDTDSLYLEHGRGIRLMREWLDELTYYRGGASLVMARRRLVG